MLRDQFEILSPDGSLAIRTNNQFAGSRPPEEQGARRRVDLNSCLQQQETVHGIDSHTPLQCPITDCVAYLDCVGGEIVDKSSCQDPAYNPEPPRFDF